MLTGLEKPPAGSGEGEEGRRKWPSWNESAGVGRSQPLSHGRLCNHSSSASKMHVTEPWRVFRARCCKEWLRPSKSSLVSQAIRSSLYSHWILYYIERGRERGGEKQRERGRVRGREGESKRERESARAREREREQERERARGRERTPSKGLTNISTLELLSSQKGRDLHDHVGILQAPPCLGSPSSAAGVPFTFSANNLQMYLSYPWLTTTPTLKDEGGGKKENDQS